MHFGADSETAESWQKIRDALRVSEFCSGNAAATFGVAEHVQHDWLLAYPYLSRYFWKAVLYCYSATS